MTLRHRAKLGYSAPKATGLFDPAREFDACGVGFIANMKGARSHQIVKDALFILENLEHRGAVGAEATLSLRGADGRTRRVTLPYRTDVFDVAEPRPEPIADLAPHVEQAVAHRLEGTACYEPSSGCSKL